MSKIDPTQMVYEGCDLEAMSQAPNYYRWIVSIIKPYVGKTVVEVGAGSGSFSRQLLTLPLKRAVLVEPTKNMYKLLQKLARKGSPRKAEVITMRGYLQDLQKKLAAAEPDTFVYINVFEHIEDDIAELKLIKKLLPKGGHVVIFVPAHMALFSKFDERIGHFRRYTKESVTELARKAGFEVEKVRYMDIVGTLPWWFSFKVMKTTKLNPNMVGVYDRFCMPIIRTIESVISFPAGKNVLLIARKK